MGFAMLVTLFIGHKTGLLCLSAEVPTQFMQDSNYDKIKKKEKSPLTAAAVRNKFWFYDQWVKNLISQVIVISGQWQYYFLHSAVFFEMSSGK